MSRSHANSVGQFPPLPAKSRIQVIEATAERLVFYLPAGGWRARAGLCVAVILLLAGWAVAVWLAHIVSELWVVGVVLTLAAVQWNFERTLLLVEPERLVVQKTLLGIKRFKETLLTSASRAELIHPRNRGLSFCAIHVRGKDGTARFGRTLSNETEEENRWIVDRINEFLSAQRAAAAGVVDHPGLVPEDLPRDSVIRVDECSPAELRFHFAVPRPSPEAWVRLLVATFFAGLMWVGLLLVLTGMLFPPQLVPPYLTTFAILFVVAFSAIAFYWWCRFCGRTTLSLASGNLTCRKHVGWLNVGPIVVIPMHTVSQVRVDCQGDRAAALWIGRLLETIHGQSFGGRPRTWSVAVSGDPPLVMRGFPSEVDADHVAALIRTRIRDTCPSPR